MRPKNLLKSAIAGFTAFAMAATLLPYNNISNIQAAETDTAIEQPIYANAAGTPETTDYLFVYFPYTNAGGKDERIYFGISEDGLNFTALNDQNFILESTQGTHGLRDPFIIRSHEGDKFYLIATDLTVAGLEQDGVNYPGQGWSENQVKGSKSIMIWESTDLVNWSEQRMRKVAPDDAGCTWAPEAYWDDELQQYVVFWASKTASDNNYGRQRLYYATTSDFDEFSEPEVWIEEAGSVIDTTVIKVGEYYYRYTKNEDDNANRYGTGSKHVYCERSKSLTSKEWELVYKDSLTEDVKWSIEGPCIYKFNDDDKENAKELAALKGITLDDSKDIYGLIADRNGNYIFPGISDDITTGKFSRLGDSQSETVDGTPIYSMPEPIASHGTIMPITSEEYNNLRLKYDEQYKTAATPYVESVETATENLTLVTKTSTDLTLPTTTADGVKITWESSNTAVIAPNGKVNRPSYKQGDATVTLTATLTATPSDADIRDQIRTKSFTITVEKKAQEVFTVTFNSDGGTSVGSQSILDGQKATMPANPQKNGYTFAGWYNGNIKYDFNSAVTSNLTLTAKWNKKQERITVKTPSKPTLKNKKKKQLTITVKKVTGAAGYQVTYSTDKKFKKKVTKNKNITKNTLTLKNLKKGKTYYVKVKAYKKDSTGKKVYSKFSKVAKLKIKK